MSALLRHTSRSITPAGSYNALSSGIRYIVIPISLLFFYIHPAYPCKGMIAGEEKERKKDEG